VNIVVISTELDHFNHRLTEINSYFATLYANRFPILSYRDLNI